MKIKKNVKKRKKRDLDKKRKKRLLHLWFKSHRVAFKPHSARTAAVLATFDSSRASQSKRRCSLCDQYNTAPSAVVFISSYCVVAYRLQQYVQYLVDTDLTVYVERGAERVEQVHDLAPA